MKTLLFVTLVLSVCSAFAELPILPTTYRKAPVATVKEHAEGGSAEAQMELALRFYAGHQVAKDAQQAFQLMHLAAEQQQPDALFLLSRMYAEGIGAKADPEKELLWFAKAIANDPGNGQLKRQYTHYLETLRNPQEFLKICADAGYAPVQHEPGRRRENGLEAEADLEQASPFPYTQRDIEDLYPDSEARQPIISVEVGDIHKNVVGNDVKGLFVRYVRPAISRAHGFSGIILAGLEFTNQKTGEQKWSFVEYLDQEPIYAGKSIYNFYVTVDVGLIDSNKLTGWAVVYGHLLPDGRTIAVFDTKQFKVDSLLELYQRNRLSQALPSYVGSYIEFESVIDVKEPVQKDTGLDLNPFD